MALTLSKIDCNPVSKLYTAVGTQDASVVAQSIAIGFIPKTITVYRTDTAGNTMWALNSSTPGVLSPLTAVTFQQTSAGAVTIVGANGFTLLSGSEAAPAAQALGQPANPASAAGATLGTATLTASSTIYIVAEG